MKRTITGWALAVLGAGCGGQTEAAKPAPQDAPKVAVTAPAKPGPQVAAEPKRPAAASKQADDGPGLVLPDSDPDAVGAKGPELPIR